jgi:hypothetical protein
MGDGWYRGERGWGTHDAFRFSLALLEGVLVLELGAHGDGGREEGRGVVKVL